MNYKHLLVAAVLSYAVIAITFRVSFLKSLAGIQPGS